MKLLFLLIILSASMNSLAARLCPLGSIEFVSCKEQSSSAVSVCRHEDDKLSIGYRPTILSSIELHPATMTEEADHYIFSQRTSGEDKFLLIIKKSTDDHTRGLFRKITAGIQTEFSFRCITRSLNL